MTGSSADAEDLAQETFLRLWRKAHTYQPGRVLPGTWLHTIAHRLCIDHFRRNGRISTEEPPEQADQESDPARRHDAAEQLRRLEAAVARLPDNQRSAILLCQVQGFSNAQAATILGIGLRALESLLARARRNLKTAIDEDGAGE